MAWSHALSTIPVLLPLCLLLSAAILLLVVTRAEALLVAAPIAEMLVCDVAAVVVVDLVMTASVVVLVVAARGLPAFVMVFSVVVEVMVEMRIGHLAQTARAGLAMASVATLCARPLSSSRSVL